jgi:hypothetical protein
MIWWRRGLIALGGVVMAIAVVGACTDDDTRPVGHLLFLAGVIVAHDAVLLPVAIGVGVLIGRYVPVGLRAAVRTAAFVSAALLVVAVPLVLGFGRSADLPSALPQAYGRGLMVVLALIWTAALAPTAAMEVGRRLSKRRG